MPQFPVSPYWQTNPSIPIYLDTGNDEQPPPPPPKEDTPEDFCSTCGTSSKDQPIHCISVSPAPPSYTSATQTPPPSSRNLTVPTLNIPTPEQFSRPQPPRPALQLDPEGRPHVRFRRTAFSPLSPPTRDHNSIDWDAKSPHGLGIAETPFRPDASPITPGTAEKGVEGETQTLPAATNIAQRIEQKLWRYTSSNNVVKRWLLEIISWIVSSVCMTGITVVLFIYKGEPIPKWPLGITLNAYISVLSKISSAGLLLPVSEALGQLKWSWFNKKRSRKMWDFEIFDNASRGPWGSLLLLVRTKGMTLAALGAAITIFALALDPFFQQVAQYPEQWREQPDNGTVQKAIGYSPYLMGKEYRLDSALKLQLSVGLDLTMTAIGRRYFFEEGIPPVAYGKGQRADFPVSCPNSNCTWPAYETVGVCNSCEDISDRLEFGCMNAALDWVEKPDRDPDTDETLYRNGTSCGWWLMADEPLLMTGYNADRGSNHSGETLLMRAQPLYDIFSRAPLPGYSPKLGYVRNPLAHVIIVSGGDATNVRLNGTAIATECLVSWCIKEMESRYSDDEGGYFERVNNTYLNRTQGPDPWQTIDIRDPDTGKLIATDYIYNENITIATPSNRYTIENFTHLMSLSVFDDAFPSTYTLRNDSTDEADAMLRYKQYIVTDPNLRNVTHNPFMFANVSDHMDNLSKALTDMIRSSDENTELETGTSFEKMTIVDVRWEWLALPLGLLALTFLFLAATIIRSSMEKDSVGVYKTSAIATLLFGLPDNMQKKIKSDNEKGTPRSNAKETKVKWVPKVGWRFSGNTLSPNSIGPRDSVSTQWR